MNTKLYATERCGVVGQLTSPAVPCILTKKCVQNPYSRLTRIFKQPLNAPQAPMENRMTHCNTESLQSPWQIIRRRASVAALSAALTVGLPPPAYADDVTSQPVLPNLEVPPGNKAFLVGHAVGTQNYVCLPSGAGFAWVFFGPQATLFNDHEKQLSTHFLSPNPDEGGTPRATWQHSRDTSTVWAIAIAVSTDAAFVAPNAIPWLLLEVAGAQDGPAGGDKLSETSFIQRVNTAGGIMPGIGCTQSSDVGKKALVPYTTDYFFYKAADSD